MRVFILAMKQPTFLFWPRIANRFNVVGFAYSHTLRKEQMFLIHFALTIPWRIYMLLLVACSTIIRMCRRQYHIVSQACWNERIQRTKKQSVTIAYDVRIIYIRGDLTEREWSQRACPSLWARINPFEFELAWRRAHWYSQGSTSIFTHQETACHTASYDCFMNVYSDVYIATYTVTFLRLGIRNDDYYIAIMRAKASLFVIVAAPWNILWKQLAVDGDKRDEASAGKQIINLISASPHYSTKQSLPLLYNNTLSSCNPLQSMPRSRRDRLRVRERR